MTASQLVLFAVLLTAPSTWAENAKTCAHDYSGTYVLENESDCTHDMPLRSGLYLVPAGRLLTDSYEPNRFKPVTHWPGLGYVPAGRAFKIRQLGCSKFEFDTEWEWPEGTKRRKVETIDFSADVTSSEDLKISKDGGLTVVHQAERIGYETWGQKVSITERGKWSWKPTDGGLITSGSFMYWGTETSVAVPVPFFKTNEIACRYTRIAR